MTAIGRRPAPAKINLGLRVLGRRPDGYHELDTVMAKLDLADFIRLEQRPEPGPDGLLATTSLSGLPPDFASPDNLALKAVAAFRLATGWPRGAVSIFLEKHIPLGAGLGGGSADGAAVLRALNQVSPLRWPPRPWPVWPCLWGPMSPLPGAIIIWPGPAG